MELLIAAIAALAASGLVGALFGRQSASGQWLSTLISVVAAIVGLTQVGRWFVGDVAGNWERSWQLVPGADFHVGLDGVSAVFLLPVFMVSLLGPVYGLGYWRQVNTPTTVASCVCSTVFARRAWHFWWWHRTRLSSCLVGN